MQIEAQAFELIRMARTSGVGMATVRKVLNRCGSAIAGAQAWDGLFQGKKPLASAASVTQELARLAQLGGRMLVWGEEGYPAALMELPDAPLVLSVLGDAALLQRRQVAVVGNRSASMHGLRWTEALCQRLARQVTVTSGLARGIDTVAHTGALAAADGQGTVAVVAGGIDHIYPPENAKLRERVIREGCLISEQPLGCAPTAQLFPRRNRIIAGLSVGVVVAEASRHSGSLLTAEFALGYGREVWAVPGTPGDPRASGPNFLLKQGAQLVEDVEDILRDLPQRPAPYVAPARAAVQTSLFAPEGAEPTTDDDDHAVEDTTATPRQLVWGLLGRVGVSDDALLRQTALPPGELQVALMGLELDGLAQRDALGGWVRV